MESFVYSEMNLTSRRKDITKIKYYGAFASALGYIIHCGNGKNSSLKSDLIIYRGLQLSREELNDKFYVGNKMNLKGFTSTTINRKTGLKFALENIEEAKEQLKIPVLLKI